MRDSNRTCQGTSTAEAYYLTECSWKDHADVTTLCRRIGDRSMMSPYMYAFETNEVNTNVWVGCGAMREEDLEVALKVVIVGDGGVGKSSMIQRYCRGTFTRDYKKTIGVDFLERQIEIDGEEVRLMLWDTAGQEEFDAITKAYYRGAHACVLAFSTTDRDSFLSLHSWKLKVENECGEIPTIIVQNKIDLMDQCVVGPDEAELVARALGCRLMRASVKEDVNVGAVFRALAARCLSDMRRDDADSLPPCQAPVIGTFTNHNSNGTILLRPTKHRPGGKKKNVLRNACRLL